MNNMKYIKYGGLGIKVFGVNEAVNMFMDYPQTLETINSVALAVSILVYLIPIMKIYETYIKEGTKI